MLTLVSLLVCSIVAFLAMPAHPLIPDYVLARIGFVAVPVTFIGSVVWIASALFSKSNQVGR